MGLILCTVSEEIFKVFNSIQFLKLHFIHIAPNHNDSCLKVIYTVR